jgi:hypothetical protein
MNFLKSFFNKKRLMSYVPQRQSLVKDVPPNRVNEVCELMYDFIMFNTKKAAVALNEWVTIPPVKVVDRFGGWGFVEGQTKAFRIDHDLHLFEFDEDLGFTNVVVLGNNVPCLVLTARGNSLTVNIIAGQDYLASVLDPSGMPLNSEEDLLAFNAPVQVILRKILGRVYQSYQLDDENRGETAIETMLAYAEKQ